MLENLSIARVSLVSFFLCRLDRIELYVTVLYKYKHHSTLAGDIV